MPTNEEIIRSLINGIVINEIHPYGDVREPGWTINGERLHHCSLHHRHDWWHGATQLELTNVMPTAFITRKVYNYLVGHNQLEGVRSKIRGVVENKYAVEIPNPYYGGGTCWILDPGSIIPGLPEPKITCTPSGSFTSIPSQISASTKTGFPVLTTTLPVTLTMARDCVTTFDKVATTPAPITSLPVIFSINDIDIATVYPTTYVVTPYRVEYPITIDLATYLTTWKHLLSTATTSMKLKARVEKQILPCAGVGDVGFKAFSVETTIPVSVCECDEGETRNPQYCWDWSTINTEICSGGLWTPTGATCPEMPAHGTKGGEIPCWDGTKIYTQIFDANVQKWIPTGETCPEMPAAGAVRGETPCWDGSKIYAEKFDAVTKTWVPTGATCPTEPPEGEKRGETPCWDGTVIYAEIFDRTTGTWIPTGATCPEMPAAGAVRGETPCWDGSKIYAEKFDAVTKKWVPTGATCPTEPPAGEKRGETTCWDGTVIYAEIFDRTTGTWIPTGETCPVKVCTEGDKRSQVICGDGSIINTEVCRDNAWVPSGETCPTRLPERVIRIAAPKIVYEGQAIDIVTQAFCGAALSSDEPATLTVDGVDVQTKNTSAGEVKFRWTAKGTGMRRVCVNIPANPKCPAAGSVCKTLTVSAYVAGIGEQIKAEKAAYEEELARLRELKRIERRPVSERAPGVVKIPASLAGVIVEIGGVPTTIPEGGMPIVVSPGENIVTIIREGVRTDVPVMVPPGGTIILPELPGGL